MEQEKLNFLKDKSKRRKQEKEILTSEDELYYLAAYDDLMSFCQVVDPKSRIDNEAYLPNWHHELIADTFMSVEKDVRAGKKRRIILSVPPRHGKSELATIRFPAWVLGRNPSWPIIVSAYSSGLATKFGERTRDLIRDERYGKIFPVVLNKSTKSKNDWAIDTVDAKGNRTKSFGSYTAVGVGGSVTGKGAKIAIIDDPIKNREEANSPLQREKIWDFWTSTLSTRLEGTGNAVIVIMTRWHVDDLVGRLIEEEKQKREAGMPHDVWEVIEFPALALQDEFYKGNLVRVEGDALWPEKLPLSELQVIRDRSLMDWAALYQQNPVLSELQEFKEEMFEPKWSENDLKGKRLKYVTLVDPAISQKKEADNTVVLTVAKEIDGANFYRIREDAGKFTPKQTIDLIFKHQSEFDSTVFIETVAFQAALKFALEEEQVKRQIYFSIKEIRPKGSKEERIRQLIPLYERGVIFGRTYGDGDYIREALEFPRGKHDDRIDCMSMIFNAFENTRKHRKKSFIPHFTGYNRLKR